MVDLLLLLLGAAVFLAFVAYVGLCDRIVSADQEPLRPVPEPAAGAGAPGGGGGGAARRDVEPADQTGVSAGGVR